MAVIMTKKRIEEFAKFLEEYAKCGVKGLAADRAGLRRHTMRDIMAQQPKFKERFEEIQERFVDGLEVVAIERAKEKSDSLLLALLRAKRPEEYGEKREISVESKGEIKLVFNDAILSDEEKQILGKKED